MGEPNISKLSDAGAEAHLVQDARETGIVAANAVADDQRVFAGADAFSSGVERGSPVFAVDVKGASALAVVGECEVIPLSDFNFEWF